MGEVRVDGDIRALEYMKIQLDAFAYAPQALFISPLKRCCSYTDTIGDNDVKQTPVRELMELRSEKTA